MSNTTINKISDVEIEITTEISSEDFMSHWAPSLKKLGANVTIDGFRKGMAPEKVLIDKIGEERILLEMAEQAISKAYPKILTENKIEAIGQPEVKITKIAKNNPLGFTIKTALLPEVKLPDYKKIAKDTLAKAEKPETATDEEVEEIIKELQKHKALTLEENKDVSPEETDKLILPEINDEFVKALGKFENVADFKNKIKENLTAEKQAKSKEKNRLAIMDAIADKIDLPIPQLLIDNELKKMLHELKHETMRMGLKFDDYLIHLKKTEDELTHGWQADATKRVKLGLIINAIIDDAKIEATKEEVQQEMSHLMSHFGEQTPNDTELGRIGAYAENTILHRKVFEMLEQGK